MRKLLLMIALFLAQWAMADVKPARLFMDHMVLQREVSVPVWGWADKGESVTLVFNGQTLKTKAGKDGKWMLKLAPMKAGGPFEMTIKGRKNTVSIKDVLIGEVWVCSGQSNMEWIVRNSNNPQEEIANANDGLIRHFKVAKATSFVAVQDLPEGQWAVCSPETVGDFTAVGYFFARELRKKLGVPVGLLNTSWGGTVAETWISAGAVSTMSDFDYLLETVRVGDLEKIKQAKQQQMEAKIGDIPEKDLGMQDGKALWADPNLNTSDWKKMPVPGAWERPLGAQFDGIIWLKTTFELTAEQAKAGVTLALGTIDDTDQTWVNGEFVGGITDQYNTVRRYAVQASALRQGKNVLVIRVTDTGGGGGLMSPKEELVVETAQGNIGLAGDWQYRIAEGKASFNIGPNDYPTLLYNAMIHPLLPYAMKGVIWYQGESNAGRAYQYRDVFPLLIKDWRAKWAQGDFPFLWVQLANFRPVQPEPIPSDWAELREAQTMTLSLPNTGQAVIIDIGEAKDIHPRNKQDVGYRLALNARKIAYGEELPYSSPMYESMQVEGNSVRIRFKHVGGGLMAKDQYGYLKGFVIAGEDQQFHWAKAELIGPNEVRVSSPAVAKPVAVRYAWADNPDDANLYSQEGLPTCPFRTDTWDGITKGRK